MLYTYVTEDEDADPVGPARDALALLTAEAVRLGLVREGDKPDQNLVDFWMTAVDAAAAVADQFRHPDTSEDTIGDVIRAALHE